MATITASVDRSGVNKRNEAITVKKLINQHIRMIASLRLLAVDGRVVPMRIGAIEDFQRHVVNILYGFAFILRGPEL